jgi:hypothetical protein
VVDVHLLVEEDCMSLQVEKKIDKLSCECMCSSSQYVYEADEQ